jgi:hypothetical protein
MVSFGYDTLISLLNTYCSFCFLIVIQFAESSISYVTTMRGHWVVYGIDMRGNKPVSIS